MVFSTRPGTSKMIPSNLIPVCTCNYVRCNQLHQVRILNSRFLESPRQLNVEFLQDSFTMRSPLEFLSENLFI
jgi:hypothetical protein